MIRLNRVCTAAAALALTLLPAACTSNMSPSNKNITSALNLYYADHNDCLYPGGLRVPYEVTAKEATTARAKGLDALTAAGLLERTEEKDIHVKRYSLTPYAKSRANASFCYGHREVTGIDSITAPTVVNGQRTIQAVYQYKLMDVPGWAQSDQMRAAFPALRQDRG